MNNDVITFINDFKDRTGYPDVVEQLFRRGYCYYFALILQTAFNRGKICWCCPIGHIVWVDDDGTPYDIEGVNHSECAEYIPIEYIGDAINDFKHVDRLSYNISQKEIYDIYMKYCREVLNKDINGEELLNYWYICK